MEPEIRYYAPRGDDAPFLRWFAGLDPRSAARVKTALGRLQAGNTSNVKSVGSGVHEIRIDQGPGYRIYFGWNGRRLIIVLAGGTKRRQQDDIETARQRWRSYQAEKAERSPSSET
jgi:putative addiction module killer protein